MRTRLAAIVAALSIFLAVASIVLIGANYLGLNADLARAAESQAQPLPSSSPMPDVESAPEDTQSPPDVEISPEQIEAERLHAIEWLEWQRLIDDCMAAAGFEEYSYSDDMTSTPFSPDYTAEQRAAAALALGGNTGAAADYHWEDAGCAGAATHQLGIGS